MLNLEIAGLLIVLMFFILGSGVWIGLALLGTGWLAMELFTSRPVGPAMVTTIWGASSSWTKSMPWSAGIDSRYIRPRARSSNSSASSTSKRCPPTSTQ